MKIYTFFWLALLTAPTLIAGDVVLIDNGAARCAVVVSERVMAPDAQAIEAGEARIPRNETEFQRQQLREAVKDLAHYLGKISGANIEIRPKPPDDFLPIFVGEAAVEKFGKPKKSAFFQQGFRVVVSAKGVGLMGESDLATTYAIYEVLDRLGCRWFMPSEMGECIPETKTIRLEEEDFSSAPGTIYRGIWQADPDYKRRNRLGGLPLSASHALDSYIPKQILDQHPDWVAVVKGKPVPPQIKWSKPEIANAVADAIIGYFDKGTYQWSASLSPEDTCFFDESEDPKSDAGDFDPIFGGVSVTDRLMLFCNRVAERVTKKHPDALFGVCSYVNYTRPPVREKLHPNIVPVIAPITYARAHPVTDDGEPNNAALRHAIEGWGKAARMTGNYYYAWFLGEQTAPNPMITKWSVDVPFALKNGCQFFQPETDCTFESTLQALWMGPRLAWNPGLKPEDLVTDLNTRFYGNAVKEMAAYWDFVDHVWVDTKTYCGAGHGHMKRFTPERMKKMRELMNTALAAAKTPQEKFRITMANESLILFESYMKMRRDLAEGRFARLDAEAATWIGRRHAMAERYRPQYAFSCRTYGSGGVWGDNNGVDFFQSWYQGTYNDAARIAKFYDVLTTPPLHQWRYAVDKEKKAEALGWLNADFDDKSWKSTDPVIDSWSDIGCHNYFGRMAYRASVPIASATAGRKTYLWAGATDGSAKVYVNGKHVAYRAPDGKTADEFTGYMQPASWNITAALKEGANQIAILCERRDVNEIGTGGLMGPVVIYREKD